MRGDSDGSAGELRLVLSHADEEAANIVRRGP